MPLSEPARNPFAEWQSAAATIRRWRLRDVVLDRELMVLLRKGRVLEETNYLQSADAVRALTVDPGRLRASGEMPVAICCDHWDANHYHWLMHGAVMLHANRALPAAKRPRPMLPRHSPVIDDTLRLLGIDEQDCLFAERPFQYRFAAVDYYDYGRGLADFAISTHTQAALDALAASVTPAEAKRVYIDRSGGGNRLLPNEAELIAALHQRGFVAIRAETMSLEQQIAQFKGADFVVANHGAGLTNIGFCRPGSVVYELVPSHYINPCFVRMAMQAGLHYWADRFDSGQGATAHTAPWAQPIDVAAVIRRIDEIDAWRG